MATGIALVLTFGLFHFASNVSFGFKLPNEHEQGLFAAEAIKKLNQTRSFAGNTELGSDPDLQAWLNDNLDSYTDEEQMVNVADMLKQLPLHLHTITSAAARTIEAENIEELIPQLEYWAEGHSEEAKVVATRLYQGRKGKIGCALIAAKKVPPFDLALLNDGVTEFYNTCKHCDKPHLGNVQKVNLALAVNCPECRKPYDLLAADMMGKYHRANSFLEGMTPPPGISSNATNRYEEMMAIWSAAAKRCRYTVDLGGSSGEKDNWQRPSETYTFQNGDCEDSSLMLADWLLSRGFEARVAVGHALGQGGHAWVVVRLDGHQYLLESTLNDAPQNPPEPELVRDQYQPHYLFDHNSLYFPQGLSSTTVDYFDPNSWHNVLYPRETWEDHSLAIGEIPAP
jgi:predicted transglutaminase-like cysteine proteinase